MPFKVIEVGINRMPICDFLLVINTNWHPVSDHFGVITAYCLNFGHFAFLKPLLGGLGTTYNIHHSAHWKARSGLTISVNWIFLLCITAEALRAKIDRKSVFWKRVGQYVPNFLAEGDISHQSFLHG